MKRIILNYIFILNYGALGAAIATAITVSTENIVKVFNIGSKKFTPIFLRYSKNDKYFLENEFLSSKNYKSDLKWFDGVWSRFKPGLGKDKRGASGVDKNKLIKVGKKISTIP